MWRSWLASTTRSNPPSRPRRTALVLTGLLACGITAGARSALPDTAPVSYEKQVKPLLVARCYACHGNGTRLGDFRMDTRAAFLTGGQTHPVVVPGDSAKSYLIKLVSGEVPGKLMPARGPRLTKAEIDLLRAWIDQGLSFGSEQSGSDWRPPLGLTRPKLTTPPPGSGLTNPIDVLLQPYFAKSKVKSRVPASRVMEKEGTRTAGLSLAAPTPARFPNPKSAIRNPKSIDDRTYCRRLYLDLVGVLPTVEELHAFLNDPSPDRRARLARQLLGDNRRYAEHWLSFWNDVLRNDYAGTGYIDGGRLQITPWLVQALETNKPYDRFVAELVNPTPESAGFIKGIVWRGVVNASQTPEMQAAQNVSQIFMGVNMKCASCHDSFINTWKLADAYGMAGIFADKPLEMVRCDRPLGQVAPIKFLYPELGTIDAGAPRAKRLEQLAAVLTAEENGRLPRTMVNRVWTRLMGRGLVEPNDEMDHRPWYPALLDWLAADFVDNGYDVKKLIERIVTSRAYQRPSVGLGSERTGDFTFQGPVVKRMSAEQFVDGVSALTGVWPAPANFFRIQRGLPVLPRGQEGAIRFRSGSMKDGQKEVDVDLSGAQILSLLVTDAGNGNNSDWANWVNPRLVVDAPPNTQHPTPNTPAEVPLTSLKWHSATTGYGTIQLDRNIVEQPMRLAGQVQEKGIGTHANSIITYRLPAGVKRFRATVGPDTGAVEQAMGRNSVDFIVIAGDRSLVEARAALALNDPLLRALGRPNREQVVTQRGTVATTLQALELTNGQVLANKLSQGARQWVEDWAKPGPDGRPRSAAALVDRLYEHALGRLPTATERKEALSLVGSPVRKEGVEDLLWVLVMLPEFQLVR